MDYKFTITCNSCGCRTELSQGKWEATGAFLCPNCKSKMPDGTFDVLKTIAANLAVICSNSEEFTIAVNSPFGWDS